MHVQKTLENLANPEQFAKALLAKCIQLKSENSRFTEKNSWDKNMLDVGADVNLEILPSCEAEARPPRFKLPINVPLTANAKVARPSMKPTKL